MRALIVAMALAAATPQAGAADISWGEHGMALFGGEEGLYASHLPMFHAPHDYQVLLRVHVADPATDAALRRRLDGKTALWTIAPEKFELSRLAPRSAAPLKQFKADLVLGHFEQGGKTQYPASTIVVDQVLLFHKLSPERRASSGASYVQVGEGGQRYLVKRIDSRPDYDHIVAYRAAPGAATNEISIDSQGLRQPGAAELARALRVRPDAIRGTVYFYTDDLK